MDRCLRRISDVSHISVFRSSTGPYLVAEMDSLHEEKEWDSVQNQQIIERNSFHCKCEFPLWFQIRIAGFQSQPHLEVLSNLLTLEKCAKPRLSLLFYAYLHQVCVI